MWPVELPASLIGTGFGRPSQIEKQNRGFAWFRMVSYGFVWFRMVSGRALLWLQVRSNVCHGSSACPSCSVPVSKQVPDSFKAAMEPQGIPSGLTTQNRICHGNVLRALVTMLPSTWRALISVNSSAAVDHFLGRQKPHGLKLRTGCWLAATAVALP